MYTLTYESKSKFNLDDSEINEILETARQFNVNHGITGCLIFYADRFIQILEGSEDKVKQLYARIETDKRHSEVSLFSEDTIRERNFPDWGMAYYTTDDVSSDVSELNQFKRNLTLLADMSKPTNVTAMLFWKKMKFLLSHPPTENA